jgi:ribosomal-protein-alanine N-acetyltransferase
VIETPRLLLRQWRDEDRVPFAAMSLDPDVMETLGGNLLTKEQSNDYIDRAQAHIEAHGFGKFAVERREDGAFLGAVGLTPIASDLPLPRGFEMGWRLARAAWGRGYASEAARAAIADALGPCGLPEIFAFTSLPNLRSQAVMERAALTRRPELDFDHPALPVGHPQQIHMVWSAKASGDGNWLAAARALDAAGAGAKRWPHRPEAASETPDPGEAEDGAFI